MATFSERPKSSFNELPFRTRRWFLSRFGFAGVGLVLSPTSFFNAFANQNDQPLLLGQPDLLPFALPKEVAVFPNNSVDINGYKYGSATAGIQKEMYIFFGEMQKTGIKPEEVFGTCKGVIYVQGHPFYIGDKGVYHSEGRVRTMADLIAGKIQLTGENFVALSHASKDAFAVTQVSGDPGSDSPTFGTMKDKGLFFDGTKLTDTSDFTLLVNSEARSVIDKNGTITKDAFTRSLGTAVTITFVDDVTGYSMPKIIVDHLSSQFGGMLGVIKYMGRPISQPYWMKVNKGGVERTILYMATERGDVTYDPDNPDPYKVELGLSGNIFGKIMLGSVDTQVQPEYYDGNRFSWTIKPDGKKGGVTFTSHKDAPLRIVPYNNEEIKKAGEIMYGQGILDDRGISLHIAKDQSDALSILRTYGQTNPIFEPLSMPIGDKDGNVVSTKYGMSLRFQNDHINYHVIYFPDNNIPINNETWQIPAGTILSSAVYHWYGSNISSASITNSDPIIQTQRAFYLSCSAEGNGI